MMHRRCHRWTLADMIGTPSGRAVKRIEDVRVLRQHQFSEDAGPMAHPVRPDRYIAAVAS